MAPEVAGMVRRVRRARSGINAQERVLPAHFESPFALRIGPVAASGPDLRSRCARPWPRAARGSAMAGLRLISTGPTPRTAPVHRVNSGITDRYLADRGGIERTHPTPARSIGGLRRPLIRFDRHPREGFPDVRIACRPLLLAAVAQLVVFAAPAGAAPQRVGCIRDRHADSPIGRFEAGTLPIDGQLCFGGFFNQAIHHGPRRRHDPLTDSWSRKADLPSPTTHVAFARGAQRLGPRRLRRRQPGHRDGRGLGLRRGPRQLHRGPSMPRPIAAGAAAVIGRHRTSADARRIATRRRATISPRPRRSWPRLAAVRLDAGASLPPVRCSAGR